MINAIQNRKILKSFDKASKIHEKESIIRIRNIKGNQRFLDNWYSKRQMVYTSRSIQLAVVCHKNSPIEKLMYLDIIYKIIKLLFLDFNATNSNQGELLLYTQWYICQVVVGLNLFGICILSY